MTKDERELLLILANRVSGILQGMAGLVGGVTGSATLQLTREMDDLSDKVRRAHQNQD